MAVPSVQASSNAHGKCFTKEDDAEAVSHSDTPKSQEGKGEAEVLCLAAALDQQTEEGADELTVIANKDQLLLPSPEKPKDDECTVYTNRQVGRLEWICYSEI